MIAVLYRMCGGFVGLGSTTLTRLRWAIPMGLLMAFLVAVHHQSWLDIIAVGVACTITAYAGRLIPHSSFQLSGSLGSALGMAGVGLSRMALLVVPYAIIGWPSLTVDLIRSSVIVLGVLQGVCYFVGYRWLAAAESGVYWRNTTAQDVIIAPAGQPDKQLDHLAWSATEWGELLTGVLVYQLAYAILLVMP